ncbi:MAG: hypothetical protein JW940_21870 [Polyangiaceae bacterium]|nr:hypothetical protein [Polyangiaceae bacterium]
MSGGDSLKRDPGAFPMGDTLFGATRLTRGESSYPQGPSAEHDRRSRALSGIVPSNATPWEAEFMSSAVQDRRPPRDLVSTDASETLAEAPDEPPVVARMIVEIRSDGTRTVARGALEDTATGQRTTLVARGSSPAALAGSLVKSLLRAPLLAPAAFRALLTRGRR